jgi:hypothetical protein
MAKYRQTFLSCHGSSAKGRFLRRFYKTSCDELLLDEETSNDLKKCLLNALIRYVAAALDPKTLQQNGGNGSPDPLAKPKQIGPDSFNDPDYRDPFTGLKNEPTFFGAPSSSKKYHTHVEPSEMASVPKRKYTIKNPITGWYTINPLEIAKLNHTVLDQIFKQIAEEFFIQTTLSGQFVCAQTGSHYAKYAIDALVSPNRKCRSEGDEILRPAFNYVKNDLMIYQMIVRDLLRLYTTRLTPDGKKPVQFDLPKNPAVFEFIQPLLGHDECQPHDMICMYLKLFEHLHIGEKNFPTLD